MGKELMRDLEDLQRAEDDFRRGDTSRKEYRAVESTVIRKATTPKPAGGKKR
ncbi:hypothetical protein ABIF63_005787 [Bradyrhizobium japonicum]|uniref:Transcriptional regulator n=1 Tax=Bradyrhizobium japonicum TaxID=375 RepID=A0ABV2RXL6_BRAJP